VSQLNTIARPYAEAAFGFASTNNSVDSWSEVLEKLALICDDKNFQKILNSPNCDDSKIKEIITSFFDQNQYTKEVDNFIDTLIYNSRLSLLPNVKEIFADLVNEHKKKEKVEIISAYALTDENIKEVTDILQKKLGNDVSISTHVNKDLIGGLKIKTKNKVWDLSVKAKIEKLAFQINK